MNSTTVLLIATALAESSSQLDEELEVRLHPEVVEKPPVRPLLPEYQNPFTEQYIPQRPYARNSSPR